MTDEIKNAEPQAAPARKGGRKKRILIPLAILLIIAAAIFLYWYHYLRGWASTDDAVIDSDPVTISSKLLGRIISLAADEGDTVRAGELLVSIDDSDLKAQESQATAGLELAHQNAKVAEIALKRAGDDYRRDSIQFQNHVIPREQYDHARQAFELAGAQLAVTKGQVGVAEAQLKVIETALANTRIIAGARGVVAKKWVMPGDIVAPGQPIFTLFDLGDVWITANFEETKLHDIRPGDSVRISVDAFPGREFTGRVDLIGAAAASQFSLIPPNNASGNFTKVTQRVPVKILLDSIDVDDPPGWPALLPGMSVEVKVRVKER